MVGSVREREQILKIRRKDYETLKDKFNKKKKDLHLNVNNELRRKLN